jgi:hypothetical protein
VFRLARDLGMTAGHLRRSISAAEFTQWAAFYSWEAEEQKKAERSGH